MSSHEHSGHNHGGHEQTGGNHPGFGQHSGLASIVDQPPHSGQITKTGMHYFEIVYQPQETRVYIYGPAQRPVSAWGVRGEVVMAVRGNPELFRYTIGGAMGSTGQSGQDYLSLPVDVSPIRDGDMQVTFHLANLPYQQEPQTQFTQTFAISRTTLPVTIAKLTAYDQLDVQRQRICPVTNSPLNDHGQPIKLMVGAEPLYVCCEGCVDEVRKRPEFFLQKARGGGRPSVGNAQPQNFVTQATAADQQTIRAQRNCPVTDQPLGGHGNPIKVVVNGQPVYVCCQGCVGKVEQHPEFFLSKAAALRNGG